jgi:hypothetical protein
VNSCSSSNEISYSLDKSKPWHEKLRRAYNLRELGARLVLKFSEHVVSHKGHRYIKEDALNFWIHVD